MHSVGLTSAPIALTRCRIGHRHTGHAWVAMIYYPTKNFLDVHFLPVLGFVSLLQLIYQFRLWLQACSLQFCVCIYSIKLQEVLEVIINLMLSGHAVLVLQ